jgi:hypothetical protein
MCVRYDVKASMVYSACRYSCLYAFSVKHFDVCVSATLFHTYWTDSFDTIADHHEAHAVILAFTYSPQSLPLLLAVYYRVQLTEVTCQQ